MAMAMSWRRGASPVTRVCFRGQRVHVKRDDVYHLAGNKMRKLYWLLQQGDAFYHDAHLVSFGGTQSNAMLAIAQLAHAKCVPFTYFSRHLVVTQPPTERIDDNLSVAKALGMQHCELSTDAYQQLAATKDLAAFVAQYVSSSTSKPLLIPQGAAFAHAEDGLRVLADELNAYCQSYGNGAHAFSVVVPCGTGTTAFYLAQHVDPAMRVLAVPCVGDNEYLRLQLDTLAAAYVPRRTIIQPTILAPSRKARFGRLARPLLDIYDELTAATAIEFDLLYAAFTWQTLFEPHNLATARGNSGDRELLYLHTGGVSGNGSMLARYRQKLS